MKFLFRYYSLISFTCIILTSLFLATYVNLITANLSHENISILELKLVLQSLGWWNTLVILAISLMYLQYRISDIPNRRSEEVKGRLIQLTIETTARALIYPYAPSDRHIRANVTLYRSADKMRVNKFNFNAEPDPERHGIFPFDFGITGKAFVECRVIIEELPETHMEEYDEKVRRFVHPDLKTIIAAPILDRTNVDGRPLGILAFDSTLEISKLKFGKDQIKNIAQNCADALSLILYAAPEYDN